MSDIKKNLQEVQESISKYPNTTLIAVSKTKPVEDLLACYEAGQRHFGENKVQEMVDKYEQLPHDIHWHMIGHLQRNKVKYIVPFVHLIHGVDSYKLALEINKEAIKANKVVNCLIQMHIAEEESKFGFDKSELNTLLNDGSLHSLKNICFKGLMGMATNTDNETHIKKEFENLTTYYQQIKATNNGNIQFDTLSMGMSGDYMLALEAGSTMIRVGSAIFGQRNYN